VKTNKDRHTLQRRKSSAWTLVSGYIRFVRIFVGFSRKKTLKDSTYVRTVWSHANARLEHLFLDFGNYCVKVNTDKPIL